MESDRTKILNDIRSTTGIGPMNQHIRNALVQSTCYEVEKLEPMRVSEGTVAVAFTGAAANVMGMVNFQGWKGDL